MFAIILLTATLPFLIVIAILIKIEDPKGPVFFTQDRPGKDAKIFRLIKFRTMKVQTEKDGKALSDMERMSKIGNLIRKTSFDELPQIWNILKGDLSFIGPRPLLERYLQRYTPEQMRRHEVTPGISGWAQVNGRNAISWEKKFELDVYYVDNISCTLDMKIFFLTIWNIIHKSGVNSDSGTTMQEFMGKGA